MTSVESSLDGGGSFFDWSSCAKRVSTASWEVDVEVEVIARAEAEERVLDFEVLDDSLERAAGERAITWIYCTHPWYYCGWPSTGRDHG